MDVAQVVEYFGSKSKAADALGVTKGAITNWKKIVPQSALWRIERATKGKLRPDLSVYERLDEQRARERKRRRVAKSKRSS